MERIFTCSVCDELKTIQNYDLGRKCDECYLSYRAGIVANSREEINECNKKRKIKLRQEQKSVIDQFKLEPCAICNNYFSIICMDFDHIEPENKKYKVSEMDCFGLDKIIEEICKCQVICANCHRVKSYNEQKKNGNGISRTTRDRIRTQNMVDSIKYAPCMDCNYIFHPSAMDFDHVEPENKVSSINDLTKRRAKLEKIVDEIIKCDLVCANCHRIREYNRRIDENNKCE